MWEARVTYVRGADGQVIEFTGRQVRKNYDKAEKRAEPVEEHRASPLVLITGRILKPLTAYIRKRFGVKSITGQASFGNEGYDFWISVALEDNTQWAGMFCESPGRKFKVWRG